MMGNSKHCQINKHSHPILPKNRKESRYVLEQAAVESLPREHAQTEAFVATKKWSVVPPGPCFVERSQLQPLKVKMYLLTKK